MDRTEGRLSFEIKSFMGKNVRLLSKLVAACCLTLITVGCERRTGADDYEATVDKFTGQLVHEGKPVLFRPGEEVMLQLVWQEKGERFGVPIMPDGTFTIGWMPLGKYSAVLQRENPKAVGREGATVQRNYTVPDGLTIVEGKTNYEVELRKGWKR